MAKKILVMTPEIESASHRGIYVYTKAMFAALKQLGFETGFLTQSAAPPHVPALRPQIIYSLACPPKYDWGTARAFFLSSAYRRCAQETANRFPLPATEWKWKFLSNVDYFLNCPGFFASLYFENQCAGKAPGDLIGRAAIRVKRAKGEIVDGATDIDFVADHGYDVVLTTSPVSIRSRTGRVKIVQTVHDLIPFEYPFIADPGAFLHQIKVAVEHATHIISVSDHTTGALTQALPCSRGKVTTLHQSNPIDHVRSSSTRQDFSLPSGFGQYGLVPNNYFVYVGAIERRKNVATLIRAFSMLDPSHRAKLVLAGPTEIEYAASLGVPSSERPTKLADDVFYLGVVPENEKIALLHNATALVFPAVAEGFGLPVVEAMSVGCPVITTRCTALGEVGADAVWYLEDPGSATELASLMSRLAESDESRADLRQRGLRRAADFSLSAYVERLNRWARATGIFDAAGGVDRAPQRG